MKRLLAFCLLFFAALGQAKVPPPARSAADAEIQRAVAAFMQQYQVPGVAVGITVDGAERYYNYGVNSRKTQAKVGANTLFEVGSVSKTFTATLASYAQVNQQLSLADHPGKYLPEMKGHDFDKVTLLNLGTHTAGGFPMQVPTQVKTDQQLTAYFQSWHPQYPAGTKRTYANPGIGMLGVIAAKSMRMPFQKAMTGVLLPKLGLTNTYLTVPPAKMAFYAQGYDDKGQPVRMSPGALWEPTYGIKTTARDLLRFVEINLDQVKVEPKLKRAIDGTHVGYYRLGEMTQGLVWEQLPYPASETSLQANSSQKVIFESNAVAALTPPRPPQANVLINKTGSTRGFGAYVAFNPARKIGIVLLMNRSVPMDGRIKLAHTILDTAGGMAK